MTPYRVYYRLGPNETWLHEPVRYEAHVAAIIATSIREAFKNAGFPHAEAEARVDDRTVSKTATIVYPPEQQN